MEFTMLKQRTNDYFQLMDSIKRLVTEYGFVPYMDGLHIRLAHPTAVDDIIRMEFPNELLEFCPITALYYQRTGEKKFAIQWTSAATEMNIEPMVAKYVVQAADNSPLTSKGSREMLLEALGLEE